jgi:hypothetical protein
MLVADIDRVSLLAGSPEPAPQILLPARRGASAGPRRRDSGLVTVRKQRHGSKVRRAAKWGINPGDITPPLNIPAQVRSKIRYVLT